MGSFPVCSELITIKLPLTFLASIMAQRCSLDNIVSDVAFILDVPMCVSHGVGAKRASGSSSIEGSLYRGMGGLEEGREKGSWLILPGRSWSA